MYEQKVSGTPYTTKKYLPANGQQQPVVYVIERDNHSFKPHHDFINFKVIDVAKEPNVDRYFIINFQCQVNEKIHLPKSSFKCYVLKQDHKIDIRGPKPIIFTKGDVHDSTSTTSHLKTKESTKTTIDQEEPMFLFGINLNENQDPVTYQTVVNQGSNPTFFESALKPAFVRPSINLESDPVITTSIVSTTTAMLTETTTVVSQIDASTLAADESTEVEASQSDPEISIIKESKVEIIDDDHTQSLSQGHQLKSLTVDVPAITPKKREVLIFDLALPSHRLQLQQYVRENEYSAFTFSNVSNQAAMKNFQVAEIAAISRPNLKILGVFTKIAFGPETVGKKFAVYVGDKKTTVEDDKDNAFFFDTKSGMIDSKLRGDFTRFLQGSQTSNVYFEETDGEVIEKIAREIPPRGQFLGHYGYNYTIPGVDVNYYLHVSDNWENNEERYDRLKDYYCSKLYDFGDKAKTDLGLVGNQFLVPEIFYHIANNDIVALRKSLLTLKSQHINLEDLVLLGVNDSSIRPYEEQQHLSVMMYACYLGNKECIDILIEAGLDMDRAELVAGNNSLSLLLQGNATDSVVNELTPLMLNETQANFMRSPFSVNNQELGILHYALKRNLKDVVTKIVSLSSGADIMLTMYDRDADQQHHYSIDDCILEQRWELFEVLIKNIDVALLDKEVRASNILGDATANQLNDASRIRLYKLLSSDQRFKNSEILKRVNKLHMEKQLITNTHTLYGQLKQTEASVVPTKTTTNSKRKF